MAHTSDSVAVDQVRELLERLRVSFGGDSAAEILACYEPEESSTVIGTDKREYWLGFSTFSTPFNAMATSPDPSSYVWAEGDPQIEVRGDMGWAIGVMTGTYHTPNGVLSMDMRTSHVVRHDAEHGWRIVHSHFSVPVPPEDEIAYGLDEELATN